MKLTSGFYRFILFIWLAGAIGCASSPEKSSTQSREVTFNLAIDRQLIAQSRVKISISVPKNVTSFTAPPHYGGGPPLMQYVSDISASDEYGNTLVVLVDKNNIKVTSGKGSIYTLRYTLSVPQKISNEIFSALPTLSEKHGRFDNNNTFLKPDGISDLPARLSVSVPDGWAVATGWGVGKEAMVSKVSQLTSGMIVVGDYRYSYAQVGAMKLNFAIRGEFTDSDLEEQFMKVFKAQQETVGPLPYKEMLVVFQEARIAEPHGTSLANSFVVDIPPGEKLRPFNLRLMGTIGHELFHQWDLYSVFPASEEGAFILTEGFANYFGVASLVRAKLMSEREFAKFLNNYRTWLEENPKYPGADYSAIQSGFSKNVESLRDLAYTKGLFVAVLLDVAIREDTDGKQSLGSWMQALISRFGGTPGYNLTDLRKLMIDLSHKPNGQAVNIFDHAFLGGEALDLNGLFTRLGILRKSKKDFSLETLQPAQSRFRMKIFEAEL
jgi:predicted metalloprotease with PDZ domain